MPILIDGHNLIGQMSDLSLADPDDEAKLLQRLRGYRNVANQPITVVFDSGSHYSLPQDRSCGWGNVLLPIVCMYMYLI